ncbi:MAG: hypothetical protein QM658_06370 [Gordonia sp. (in: high G+C Gram-positive bacteria)]
MTAKTESTPRSPFLPADAEPHKELLEESKYPRDRWYQAMRAGELPYILLGGVRYVRRGDVAALIEKEFERQRPREPIAS